MATKKARRDYRTPAGVKLPGVTTVIGDTLGWGKQALIGWAYKLGKEGRSLRERDEAADLGTITHEIAGALLGGEAVDEKWTAEQIEKATPNGERVAAHILERYEVLHVELPIVGAHCGGTLDYVLRARSDGALVLGDLKTGKGVYDEVTVQMGAYSWLWDNFVGPPEGGFLRCAIFHAPYGETLAEVEITADQLDAGEDIFEHCLDIYGLRARCAMVRP
jgi:hypothetical protein